jgi:hypothetical protein
MEKQFFTGTMCLSDMLDFAKKGHSAFSKANNEKIYFSFKQWLNEEKDKYGNDGSIQLNSKKESKQKDLDANGGKEVYIGNFKVQSKAEPQKLIVVESDLSLGDLPF